MNLIAESARNRLGDVFGHRFCGGIDLLKWRRLIQVRIQKRLDHFFECSLEIVKITK